MQTKKNNKANTTPTPKINSACVGSLKVIFPMQPSVHWLTHVSEGVVYDKGKHVNQQTKNI